MNTNQNKEGMAILITGKAGFRENKITEEREGHCKMIKGSTHQNEITTLNVYASNNRTVKCMSKN